MQKGKKQIVISTNYVGFSRTLICAFLLFFNFAFSQQIPEDSASVNKTKHTTSIQTAIFIAEGTSVYGLYDEKNKLSESEYLSSESKIYVSEGTFLYAPENIIKGHIIESEPTEKKLSIVKTNKSSRNLKHDNPEVKIIVQKDAHIRLVYNTSENQSHFSLSNIAKNIGVFSNSFLTGKKFIQNTTEYKLQHNSTEIIRRTFNGHIFDDHLSFFKSYFTRPPPSSIS